MWRAGGWSSPAKSSAAAIDRPSPRGTGVPDETEEEMQEGKRMQKQFGTSISIFFSRKRRGEGGTGEKGRPGWAAPLALRSKVAGITQGNSRSPLLLRFESPPRSFRRKRCRCRCRHRRACSSLLLTADGLHVPVVWRGRGGGGFGLGRGRLHLVRAASSRTAAARSSTTSQLPTMQKKRNSKRICS